MNKYLVEQKIKTLSKLSIGLNNNQRKFPEMIIDGYVFIQWDFNFYKGWLGYAWLVKKEIEAKSCTEATNIFGQELDKIVQKVGFVSQCYMDFYREPFLFYKINNNNNKIFFYKHIQEIKGVGLPFGDKELNDYKKIKKFKFSATFRFLQECRNTIGYMPKLMLLFSALEAMCDKKEIEKEDGSVYTTYDKDKMKKILDHSLYDEVFGENGIRHKLNHGVMINSVFSKNYVDEIYKSILCYFNQKQKTNVNKDVISPQRHFYDNQEYLKCWLRPKDDFEINLKNCINNFDRENKSISGCKFVFGIDVNKY